MKIMTHLIAGFPNLDYSKKVAQLLANSGADILEIQIPFSDPIADGPTIAQANTQALAKNTTPKKCFQMIRSLKIHQTTTITVMTYFNIILKYGIEKFCKDAAASNISAIIVPDYPYDEEPHNRLLTIAQKHHTPLIPVLAPTTRLPRLKKILTHYKSAPFIYCTARSGITGNKTTINKSTIAYLKKIRQLTSLPIAIGFGIQTPQQLTQLSPHADIAIIGSALIKTYAQFPQTQGLQKLQSKFGTLHAWHSVL